MLQNAFTHKVRLNQSIGSKFEPPSRLQTPVKVGEDTDGTTTGIGTGLAIIHIGTASSSGSDSSDEGD